MKLDLKLAPQNGPVLSYSVASDRGWNDPPSFVFSPNTGNRKRIDPRKRVSHNISSMNNGYNGSPTVQSFQPIHPNGQQPPQPNLPIQPTPPIVNHQPPIVNHQPTAQPNFYNQPQQPPQVNNLSNGFSGMSLVPTPNQMHHASSNPDLHQMNYMNHQQPPMMHHSTSVPAHINQAGQNRIPGHAFGNLTPPPSSSNTPPLVQSRSGSATPPHAYIHNNQALANGRKMSAPSVPCYNSIFNQHGTPTMLQSSHRQTDSPISTPGTTATLNSPSSLPPRISPMPPTPAVPEHLTANVYARSQSNPEPFRKPSPVSMAPPTSGYYAQKSGGNSPKSLSPGNSGHCSPTPSMEPPASSGVDSENLKNTLNSLNGFKSKCSCHLTSKLSDDINKKLQTLETAWKNGKLSANTKTKISQLAQALNNNDIQTADMLHKRLIHEHSTEVTSWIIGIKKLINVYHQSFQQQQQH